MKKFIRKVFTLLLLFVFVSVGLFVAAGWIKYKKVTSNIPLDAAIEKIKNTENYTTSDKISETFINAMVAVEDKRFFQHKGIDIIGVIRAIGKNVKEKSLAEGGSGITQQLAKNLYFINDNTFTRKIAEVFVAIELEKRMTKDEILELYFNVIYYGSGYYNIYDASNGYFKKMPNELNDYEATLLAGIPNAPSVYSLKNNPNLAKKRQIIVVNAMVSMNYLTKDEADAIIAQQ